MKFERLVPRWQNEMVIIAATGPSMTRDVADRIRDHRVIAISDAYKLLPDADVLYSADAAWWRVHKGCPDFKGEKWTTHNGLGRSGSEVAENFGLKVANGKPGNTYSSARDLIHFGRSSGFQALNLALHWGASKIILVGYNMQAVKGKRHFFGDHPRPLYNGNHQHFCRSFNEAVRSLPKHVEVINATPNSALKCFKKMELNDAIGSLTAL